MSKSFNPHKNQRGQLAVEAVLLMALLVSISVFVSNYLKNAEFAQRIVAKPWERMAGMVECGKWGPCQRGIHPSTSSRIVSWLPEDQQ